MIKIKAYVAVLCITGIAFSVSAAHQKLSLKELQASAGQQKFSLEELKGWATEIN